MAKAVEAFRTISEVADLLEIPKHVLRFWEAKFPQVRPMKRGGGRRYYRPTDVELLRGIRHLLQAQGYTIKGAQKVLRDQGVDFVKAYGQGQSEPTPAAENPSGGAAAAPAMPAAGGARPRARSADKGRKPTTAKRPSAAAARPLGGSQRARIELVLQELEACRRILAAAVSAPTEDLGKPAAVMKPA